MKYLSNKQWVLPSIAVASIILSLVGVTQARSQLEVAQPNSGSLSPDDPAAKLDPSLVNIQAMPEQNTDSSPTYPLSPNDPAAKLDPSLVNIQAMPEQSTYRSPPSSSTQSPDQEIHYDPSTSSIRVGEPTPVKSSSKSTRVSPPYRGTDSNLD